MIYVDTGPLLARYLARDQHHGQAVAGWKRLAASREGLFTSNFVLDEMITLLARRAGHAFAIERARNVYASPRLTVLRPVEKDELQALELLQRYGEQGASFTDCVSFALMRSRRLRRAFTFDRHFEAAGFEIWGPQ